MAIRPVSEYDGIDIPEFCACRPGASDVALVQWARVAGLFTQGAVELKLDDVTDEISVRKYRNTP